MRARAKFLTIMGFIGAVLFSFGPARAAVVEYDLTIAEQQINLTGRAVASMTINGAIPGPTLRFREGDVALIHVHNQLRVATSLHWHGILLPPGMDGVPFVSFPPIAAGRTFTYEFPLRQSGTYWYHSHTALQEQSGVYGALVIEPREPRLQPDRDYVVLFSDWTDEDPARVLRTLKRGSEWYALAKGSGQSILGAARLGRLGDYFKRELQRMPAMDLADVAYDYFLANGQPETFLAAQPGETVRLRLIDGSSTTFFHLEFAGGPMQIVAADGLAVEPVEEQRLLIAVAETYDVLIKMPAPAGSYELRATAQDGSAYASVWLGTGARRPAPAVPRPNLYQGHMGHLSLASLLALTPAGAMGMPDRDVAAGRFDQPGPLGMGAMSMEMRPDRAGMHHNGPAMPMPAPAPTPNPPADPLVADQPPAQHQHGGHPPDMAPGRPAMAMASQGPPPGGKQYGGRFGFLAADVANFKNLAVDGLDPARPWPPYDRLRALEPTALPPDKPVREIRLTLDGDMTRYIWLLNNKPLAASDAILIRAGEIVRFIMINRTMMHHPMHLHGHLFRVINGQGNQAPLKHTVNVAPMSTTVIEFDAQEPGDWFFHCHLLYHMESGMATVVHYDGYQPPPDLAGIRPRLYDDTWYFYGTGNFLSNMTAGQAVLADSRHLLTADWEIGWRQVDDTDWEGIFTWGRYLNRFLTVFAGLDWAGADTDRERARGILGLHYLLPLNIESRLWLDAGGAARLNLQKDFALTPRLTLHGAAEYDTQQKWEGSAGLTYLLSRAWSLAGLWHAEYGWGGGLQVRF